MHLGPLLTLKILHSIQSYEGKVSQERYVPKEQLFCTVSIRDHLKPTASLLLVLLAEDVMTVTASLLNLLFSD